MTPTRWGILGPGRISHAFASDLRLVPGAELVAVGSRSAARAQEFAREHDVPAAHGSYEDLVADPAVDVVYIASPHSHHLQHARLCFEAGKHAIAAVIDAGVDHRIDMRAEHDRRLAFVGAILPDAEDVADAVDGDLKPSLFQPADEAVAAEPVHVGGGDTDQPALRVAADSAEFLDAAQKPVGGHYTSDNIASFAAIFPTDGPVDGDRYLVLVMYDSPQGGPSSNGSRQGGYVAAPVAGRIIDRIAPFVGVERKTDKFSGPQWDKAPVAAKTAIAR